MKRRGMDWEDSLETYTMPGLGHQINVERCIFAQVFHFEFYQGVLSMLQNNQKRIQASLFDNTV